MTSERERATSIGSRDCHVSSVLGPCPTHSLPAPSRGWGGRNPFSPDQCGYKPTSRSGRLGAAKRLKPLKTAYNSMRDPLPEPHPEHFARARRVSAQRNACRNAGLKARDMRGDIPMSVVEHANCHVVCSDRTYLRTCDGVGVCEQSRYRSNLRGTASTPVESKKAHGEVVPDQLAPQLSSCTAACCDAPPPLL